MEASIALDAGVAERARFLILELEPVGGQGAQPATGVGQRRFGAEAPARDKRHNCSDYNAGRVAIVEPAGLAELAHHLGKDGLMIAEVPDQQPDHQTAQRADQDGKKALIQAQRRCGLFPDQNRALMDDGHEGEGHQGGDQAEHDDERHKLDVTYRFGLRVDHCSISWGDSISVTLGPMPAVSADFQPK